MNTLLRISSTIFSIFLLCSCSKDKGFLGIGGEGGKTVVEGIVLEQGSGKPVPNIAVFMKSRSDDFCCAYNNLEREEKTGSDGKFSFSFDAEVEKEYEIVSYESYGRYGSVNKIELNEGRKNKNLKLEVSPIAWVKFILHDEPPLLIGRQVIVTGFIPADGNQVAEIYETPDTTFVKTYFGNEQGRVIWAIMQNGNQEIEKHIIPIYTPGLDTTEFIINY